MARTRPFFDDDHPIWETGHAGPGPAPRIHERFQPQVLEKAGAEAYDWIYQSSYREAFLGPGWQPPWEELDPVLKGAWIAVAQIVIGTVYPPGVEVHVQRARRGRQPRT